METVNLVFSWALKAWKEGYNVNNNFNVTTLL